MPHPRKNNPKSDTVAERAAVKAGGAPALDSIDFVEALARKLENRKSGNKALLTIPIWGWTGDGKTCSLLTAIHFCDPNQHPLGFFPITDRDELVSLENSVEEYKGLSLAATAQATTEKLRALGELFIDNNEWPPGTDDPSAYVLAVRSVNSTLGYALFPDIKGGSFRELDETAREVLRNAHAAILLVNPGLYVRNTTDGRRYRNEILDRLQKFNESQTPVCVMITKADLSQGPNEATDTTHRQLSMAVDRQPHFNALVARVSVVGLDKRLDDNRLPPVDERTPDALVKAWLWIATQALCRPVNLSRVVLPPVNMRAIAARVPIVSPKVVPELRQVGDYSDSPGEVLCACGDDSRSVSFAFLSGGGVLHETTLKPAVDAEPAFKELGRLVDWPSDGVKEIQSHYLSGEFMIGPRQECNFVWQGGRGGHLPKVPLPFELATWVPVSPQRLVGLDKTGRLHSLRQQAGKWMQDDYIEGFIGQTGLLRVAFSDAGSHVVAFNGNAVEGILLDGNGRFGARVATGLVCEYDTYPAVTNRMGLCLATTESAEAVLSGVSRQHRLGGVDGEMLVSVALAPMSAVAAVFGVDKRLSAAVVVGMELKKTADEYSPELHSAPDSMSWTRSGDALVATFSDGTWRVFRPHGLTS
ncbi:hypothetical protein [Myxococcus eversor]|uniref:hypothetical protein n=1 Tax=Myxococcus eversor TaxID=2709661 RepID=UPI0013D0152C|nr:hypothetical protein [Myxococcus eversor]